MKTWREYAGVILLFVLLGALIVNYLRPLEFTSTNPDIDNGDANEESLSMLWADASVDFDSVYTDLRLATLVLAVIIFVSVFSTTQILSRTLEDET